MKAFWAILGFVLGVSKLFKKSFWGTKTFWQMLPGLKNCQLFKNPFRPSTRHWKWLLPYLKKETEGLTFVAQEQERTGQEKTLIVKRYQKNVEYVGKEMSPSLTWLQIVKICPRKSTNEDMIILQELYTRNYAKSLAELARLSGIITSL